MLTTNTVKIKERSQEDVKLTKVTTNETGVKGFELKGKGKPPSKDFITTSNMETYQAKREKEIVKEDAAAKIRQKKLDDKIKANKEKK